MSTIDESDPPETPEGSDAAHPEGAAPVTPTPAPEGQAPDTARVAELSKEAAAYRRKLRELEAKVAEHERAQMSEADRLKAEAEDAKAALAQEREARARERAESRVVAAAAKANAVDPDAVWALLRDKAVAEGDDLDADALVKAELKARPFLARHPASGSDADPARSHAGERRETDEQRRARQRGPVASDAFFGAADAKSRGGGVFFRSPT